MSERGVFAIDRGVFDHDRFADEPYTEREAWMWLIGQAAFRPYARRVGKARMTLQRGQLAHSTRFMADKWQWSESRVRRYLSRLKGSPPKIDAMIDAATDAGVTVITICNYDTYQRVSLPDDAATDAKNDAAATQQRRKEEDIKYIKPTPIENPSTDIGAVAEATRPAPGKVFDEEFWPAYPKREGANPKAPARKAFAIAVKNGADPADIVGGAKRYAAELVASRKLGTAFVARALTWLHERRWEDYPATAPPEDVPAFLKPPPGMLSLEQIRASYGASNEQIGTKVRVDPGVGEDGGDRREELPLSGGGARGAQEPGARRGTPDDQSR